MRSIVAALIAASLSLAAGTAASLDFAVPGFGTLDQEKGYYRARGWAWTPDQEPSGPPNPGSSYFVTGVDVHGDTEADDLWQNLLMWQRTRNRQYLDLAAQWARYFKTEYRTGGLVDDLQFGGDHMWGWGLVDWWELTQDRAALDEAVRLAAVSESVYGGRTGDIASTAGLRGVARHLLLVMRVAQATQDPRWIQLRDHIASLLLRTSMWDPNYGTYLWPRPISSTVTFPRTVSPVHSGYANWALYRYHELTGNPEARQRLIAMARFAQRFALHAARQYSGNYIAVDYPSPGQVFHGRWDDGSGLMEPGHTVAWIDTLIRGYRLTGDRALLDRAYYHWERASKARYGDATYRAPADRVGRFVNRHFLSNTPFYLENGDLSFAALLFADSPGSSPPASPSDLRISGGDPLPAWSPPRPGGQARLISRHSDACGPRTHEAARQRCPQARPHLREVSSHCSESLQVGHRAMPKGFSLALFAEWMLLPVSAGPTRGCQARWMTTGG